MFFWLTVKNQLQHQQEEKKDRARRPDEVVQPKCSAPTARFVPHTLAGGGIGQRHKDRRQEQERIQNHQYVQDHTPLAFAVFDKEEPKVQQKREE